MCVTSLLSSDLPAVREGRCVEAHMWRISDRCQLGHDSCSLHQVWGADPHQPENAKSNISLSPNLVHTTLPIFFLILDPKPFLTLIEMRIVESESQNLSTHKDKANSRLEGDWVAARFKSSNHSFDLIKFVQLSRRNLRALTVCSPRQH